MNHGGESSVPKKEGSNKGTYQTRDLLNRGFTYCGWTNPAPAALGFCQPVLIGFHASQHVHFVDFVTVGAGGRGWGGGGGKGTGVVIQVLAGRLLLVFLSFKGGGE